jgi:DNA-binding winged helix-turn-helix (wHTH) protein
VIRRVLGNEVSFGPFVLEVTQRSLWYAGTRVTLKPKESELLALLAQRRPNALSKDELIERLWSGSAASDAALTQTIYRLRRTLARHAGNGQEFILTVHGVGFSLVGESLIELRGDRIDALRPVLGSYQQALYEYRRRTAPSLLASIPLFEHVLAQDPQYLPALLMLAKAYTSAGIQLLIQPQLAYTRAMQALLAAIERDPASPDTFATLSTLLTFFDGASPRARHAAEQALLLAPNSPTAHRAAAWERLASGNVASALAHVDVVVQSGGASHRAAALLGTMLYLARRYDDAHACLGAVRAVAPFEPLALLFDASAYAVTERYAQALELLDEMRGDELLPRAYAVRGYIAARRNDATGCANALAKLEAMPIPTNIPRAAIYRARGENDRADEAFRIARSLREPAMFIATIDPLYDVRVTAVISRDETLSISRDTM